MRRVLFYAGEHWITAHEDGAIEVKDGVTREMLAEALLNIERIRQEQMEQADKDRDFLFGCLRGPKWRIAWPLGSGILLLLLLAACQPTDPFRAGKKISAADLLKPTVTARAVSALAQALAPTEIRGVIKFIPTPSQCQMAGGVLPYVYPEWREPRVGQELRIQWTTRASRPFVTDEPAVLMISDRPREDGPLSGEPWGHHGCWLAVRPDWVLEPVAGTIFQREGGVLELRWTPDDSMVGRTFYVQMLLGTLETESRLAVSPAIEVTIGSR